MFRHPLPSHAFVLSLALLGAPLLPVSAAAPGVRKIDLGAVPGQPGRHLYKFLVPAGSLTQSGFRSGDQCYNGFGGGEALNGNPNSALRVGELPPVSGPQNSCRAYILWNLTGLLPLTARAVSVSLAPLSISSFTGSSNGLRVTDLHYAPDLTSIPDTYSQPLWDDLGAMDNGRMEYGLQYVTGAGDLTIPLLAQAATDLNDRLRSRNWFGVGLAWSAVSYDNHLIVNAGTSVLSVIYEDYLPSRFMINRVRVDNPGFGQPAQFDLYNNGDAAQLGGWTISAQNILGSFGSFTLPPTVFGRHERMRIIDAAGVNSPGTIYTGGGRFTISTAAGVVEIGISGVGPYPAPGIPDYLCLGSTAMYSWPPVWLGPCIAPFPAPGTDVYRIRDADTDTAGDWALATLAGDPEVMPGQTGNRRHSEVFINQIGIESFGGNAIEIANYGPDIDLGGWRLKIYGGFPGTLRGSYTLSPGILASGAVRVIYEGEMGFTTGWNSFPRGGEVILEKPSLSFQKTADYVPFGTPDILHTPADFDWTGGTIPVSGASTAHLLRKSDLIDPSAAGWLESASSSNLWQLSPEQKGPSRLQYELGGRLGANYSYYGGSFYGAGTVFTLTRPLALEAFAIEATTAGAPMNGRLVLKQSFGAPLLNQPVMLTLTGRQMVSTGELATPVILQPGTYAAMLYLEGEWLTTEAAPGRWDLGTVGGVSHEPGGYPGSPLSVDEPGRALRTIFKFAEGPSIATASPLPDAALGQPYNLTFTSTGGMGTNRFWMLMAGALPSGLNLDGTGLLSGSPFQQGNFSFTVRVADEAGLYNEKVFALAVLNPIEITNTTLPDGELGVNYALPLSVSGGIAPYYWSVISGALPPGVFIDANTGVLNGTPTAIGAYPFTVQVTDSTSTIATASLGITVQDALAVTTMTLPGATRYSAYAQTLATSGGVAPMSWILTLGSLPPGLTLGVGGEISGTPDGAGDYTFTAQVTDYWSVTAGREFTLTVQDAVRIITVSLPGGQLGASYQQALLAEGGTPPYGWSVIGGALPPGINLNGVTGELTGSPITAGNYSFTIQVSDGVRTDGRLYSVEIWNLNLLNSRLPTGYVGVPYPATVLEAEGGTAPYGWQLAAGPLPAGIVFSAGQHRLTGTPAPGSGGDWPLTFRVTDAGGRVADFIRILSVAPAPIAQEWTPRGVYGGEMGRPALSPNYATDGTLFMPGEGEIFRSTDRGQSWARIPVNSAGRFLRVIAIALSPVFDLNAATTDGGTVFVLVASGPSDAGAVWKSTDHGVNFTLASGGLPCPGGGCTSTTAFLDLAISPDYVNDRSLWLVYAGPGLYDEIWRTTTAGTAWSYASFAPNPHSGYMNRTLRLLPSPNIAQDQRLYLIQYLTVHRSSDRGGTWTLRHDAFGTTIAGAALSPDTAAEQTLVLWKYDDKLSRSFDGGASFTAIEDGAQPVFLQRPAQPPLLFYYRDSDPAPNSYVMPAYKLAMSDNAGATTSVLYGGGLGYDIQSFNALAAGLSAAGTPELWAASDNSLASSRDGGDSFVSRDRGVAVQRFTGAAAGAAGTALVAGGGNAWYLSADSGVNFVRRPWPWTYGTERVALSPDYANDRLAFVANSQWLNRFRTDDGSMQVATYPNGYSGTLALAFVPGFTAAGGVMYAGSSGDGLLRSSDGGQSFATVTLPSPCGLNRVSGSEYPYINALAVSPSYAADQTLFAGGFIAYTAPGDRPSRLCKTTDGGATWSVIAQYTAPYPDGHALALSPVYDESGLNGTPAKTLIYTSQGVFYRSTDGGATAAPVSGLSGPWPRPDKLSIVFSPNYAVDGTIFVAAGSDWPNAGAAGIWRSGDYGLNFTRTGAADIGQRFISALVLPAAFDGRLTANSPAIAFTQGGALWSSDDGGRTFAPSGGYRFLSGKVNGMAIVPGGLQGIISGTETRTAPQLPASASLVPGSILAATADLGVFRSDDGGATFASFNTGLGAAVNATAIAVPAAAPASALTAVAGQGLWRYNGSAWAAVPTANAGNFTHILDAGGELYASRDDGTSLKSTDNGVSWSPLAAGEGELAAMDLNATMAFSGAKSSTANVAATVTAPLWGVATTSGARWSDTGGTSWSAAPGGNDYVLPPLAGTTASRYKTVAALGLNPASGGREVVAGSTAGLYLSRDGGNTWRSVSGAGSGLEATSLNMSALLSTVTAAGTTDILVGATGNTNGGVYLSGDGGEHWTQVNAGFDPNNLSISSLVKTSCPGCPVQYYSGSYGGGLYTRTITVVSPPFYATPASWCAGAACACGTGTATLQVNGGQPFKICGSNFQDGLVVEFDGVPAIGCTQSGGTTLTCTGSPAHAAGASMVRLRNPDTRTGYLPSTAFQFTGGSSRPGNSLRVAKATANAALTWICASCDAAHPARVYRSQNPVFSLYLEQYNGGTGGAYPNTNAVSSGQNYFWTVE